MTFRLRTFLISIILFGTVAGSMFAFTGDIFDSYGVNDDVRDSRLAELSNRTYDQANANITNSKQQAEGIGGGIAENLFQLKSVWNVLKITLGSIGLVEDMAAVFVDTLGIHPRWVLAISSILTVLVIYELVTLYRGIRS